MPVTTRHSPSTLSSQTLPFLSLPAEIRRMIYAALMTRQHPPLLLTKAAPDDPQVERERASHTEMRAAANLQARPFSHSFPIVMLCTNRQIHAKATHYFYTHATRRLHVGCNSAARRVWPYRDWPYQYRGWIVVEIVAETRPWWASIRKQHMNRDLEATLRGLKESKVRSVFVRSRYHRLEDICRDRYMAALGALVGERNEVVVGLLRNREDGKDEWAYHFARKALRDGMGNGPYGDINYERVIPLDFEEGEDAKSLWRRFRDRDG